MNDMENNKNYNIEEGSSTGLTPNVAAALSYVFGFITGIVFIIIEKENKFVRFHAMQSILVSVALIIINAVLALIPVIGWLISILIAPLALILWIILLYKSYNNEWFELPIIGRIAREQSDKMNL